MSQVERKQIVLTGRPARFGARPVRRVQRSDGMSGLADGYRYCQQLTAPLGPPVQYTDGLSLAEAA